MKIQTSKSGFTLIEAMISIVVVTIAIFGTYSAITQSTKQEVNTSRIIQMNTVLDQLLSRFASSMQLYPNTTIRNPSGGAKTLGSGVNALAYVSCFSLEGTPYLAGDDFHGMKLFDFTSLPANTISGATINPKCFNLSDNTHLSCIYRCAGTQVSSKYPVLEVHFRYDSVSSAQATVAIILINNQGNTVMPIAFAEKHIVIESHLGVPYNGDIPTPQ
jgi:prepilin-type N-terminal cleavage/methylation domain-containing protein